MDFRVKEQFLVADRRNHAAWVPVPHVCKSLCQKSEANQKTMQRVFIEFVGPLEEIVKQVVFTLDVALQKRMGERVLVLKMVEKAGFRDANGGDELFNGSAAKALFEDCRLGNREEPLACITAARLCFRHDLSPRIWSICSTVPRVQLTDAGLTLACVDLSHFVRFLSFLECKFYLTASGLGILPQTDHPPDQSAALNSWRRTREENKPMSTKAKYRDQLPQLLDRPFLTDGGFETTMVFHEGWDLPMFEAFVLLDSEKGQDDIRRYFDHYVSIAKEDAKGFIFESPTWRANPDWGQRAGYDLARLGAANQKSIELLKEMRDENETAGSPMVVSGCIGPRHDGYQADTSMSAEEAERYHVWQVKQLSEAGVDLITAITMTNINEAIGVANAARAVGCPAVISFTVETDGRIPSGESLAEAVEAVDAATDNYPIYFMVNCAHPTHFAPIFEKGAHWMKRIRGLRANASSKSHEELDNSTELDDGNPVELGEQYGAIQKDHPHITVLGGCCGTDHRHIAEISRHCGQIAA